MIWIALVFAIEMPALKICHTVICERIEKQKRPEADILFGMENLS